MKSTSYTWSNTIYDWNPHILMISRDKAMHVFSSLVCCNISWGTDRTRMPFVCTFRNNYWQLPDWSTRFDTNCNDRFHQMVEVGCGRVLGDAAAEAEVASSCLQQIKPSVTWDVVNRPTVFHIYFFFDNQLRNTPIHFDVSSKTG